MLISNTEDHKMSFFESNKFQPPGLIVSSSESFWNGPILIEFLLMQLEIFFGELMTNSFGTYIFLHSFHGFGAGRLPLNFGILISLVTLLRILSALSKYVLCFCVEFFDTSEMKIFFLGFFAFSFYSL